MLHAWTRHDAAASRHTQGQWAPHECMCLLPAAMCDLEMQLVSEEVASMSQALLPPTNALRNRALALADTEVPILAPEPLPRLQPRLPHHHCALPVSATCGLSKEACASATVICACLRPDDCSVDGKAAHSRTLTSAWGDVMYSGGR